jgi:hypothetical protein
MPVEEALLQRLKARLLIVNLPIMLVKVEETDMVMLRISVVKTRQLMGIYF